MSDGDVKIKVSADADLKQIEATQQKIKELEQAAKAYDAKGMDTAAKSARADARELEREVAKFTKDRAATEKVISKERADAEKAATKEVREQEALRKAGVQQQSNIARAVTTGGIGVLVGEIVSSTLDQLSASETLGNRRVATESRNARQYAIINSIRGSSGQAASEAWAAEDNVAQLKRERPQLQSDQKFNAWKATAEGMGWGGGIGAGIGTLVAPGIGTAIGTAIGVTVGAAVKGIPAYLQGRNRLAQSEQDQKQEEERAQKLSDLAPKLFMEQEGGLQLDKLRQRSKRTMQGSREAFADEMAEEWLKVYRDVYNRTKGNDGVAREMAGLTVENNLRDRQAMAGAGLVDGHSGGAEIAAAAQWGQRAFGIEQILSPKLDALIGHVADGNASIRLINQAK